MFKRIIFSLLIGIIIGGLGTGVAGYYFYFRPIVDGVRTELAASRADAEQYRIRAEESERRIRDVEGIITESTTTISGTISTIQQARDKVRGIIETLRKIRETIEVEEFGDGR